MTVAKRVTYYLDDDGAGVIDISREDLSVLISAYNPDSDTEPSLEVFIGPSLFAALRTAMDRAESAYSREKEKR